ncbi:MAG: class II aldolase/adducin family protein [Candidatus Limnocylindria bacterium]
MPDRTTTTVRARPTPPADPTLRAEIVTAARILDTERLVEAFGHVSARARDRGGRERLMITPRRALSLVTAADLATLDLATGATLRGRPPLEVALHLAIYRARPDVGAICRTHSPMVAVFGALGRPIRPVHGFGTWLGARVPVFETTLLVADATLAKRVAAALGDGPALILRGNGAFVTGSTVAEATFKAIVLEEAARIGYQAALLGTPRFYPAAAIAARLAMDRADEPVRAWAHYARRAGLSASSGRRRPRASARS